MKIYYGKAIYDQKEIQASLKVLKDKSLTLIDGPAVKKLENKISNSFGKKYGLMVNSGSSANLLALASLNLKKGSEVITTTLTFSTTVAPIYQLGLIPHFIDVDKNTFVANVDQIIKAINKKTKAIMPVHLGGQSPDLISISEIAENHNILVVEDASHAIGSKYYSGSDDVNVGSCLHSKITTFSFHPVKNMTMGEGGATLTNDQKIDDKIKLLRNHGIKRSTNPQTPWVYKMDDVGYNYRASDINCALGLSQLDRLDQFVKKRCDFSC